MSDFSQDIQNFQRYGTYEYKFDSVGNLTFNSSSTDFSQVYLAFPLQNVFYNNGKIKTFYNVDFEEFVPQELTSSAQQITALEEQMQVLQQENITLKSQLDTVIAENSDSGSVDVLATKQVIFELRKALGQGRVESDFSEDFPYTPVKKTKK
jgi:uncharacterized protein (UPF0335 family)